MSFGEVSIQLTTSSSYLAKLPSLEDHQCWCQTDLPFHSHIDNATIASITCKVPRNTKHIWKISTSANRSRRTHAILSKNVKVEETKMATPFWCSEVTFKEEDCDELFELSQWKLELRDCKLQTLLLTTKTQGSIIPLWVSIKKTQRYIISLVLGYKQGTLGI